MGGVFSLGEVEMLLPVLESTEGGDGDRVAGDRL